MKKITLLAATAALALSANAQYVTDNAGIQPVLDKGTKTIYAWVLHGETVDEAKQAGVNVIDQMINDETRFLYIWENTFVRNETSANPVGVDFKGDDHVAFTVGSVGWSGAGFYQDKSGMDLSGIDENTRFHMGYCAMSNPVPSLGIVLLNSENEGDMKAKPAHISVGSAFNDNGAIYPPVGPAANDEWQAIDMSLGEIKKLFPEFVIPALPDFTGNYLAILGGGVQGQNIDLDAIYLYSTSEAGINGVEVDSADIMVTGKTINASGAKSMVLYDLAGKEVKRANSSILGLNGVGAGLYIVKADNAVAKVLVK
ncbi:MAG: hypothetical protein K2M06_05115 [Muribaculaceae bacterium]|nr:hypothetical protein [Muribaculaceae bacterium]